MFFFISVWINLVSEPPVRTREGKGGRDASALLPPAVTCCLPQHLAARDARWPKEMITSLVFPVDLYITKRT